MDFLLHKAMKALCENCRAIAYCVVKLLAIKVEELDVCENLVLSNPVTFRLFKDGNHSVTGKEIYVG